jgi:hypothetical protein
LVPSRQDVGLAGLIIRPRQVLSLRLFFLALRREVERELTGEVSELWELVYFKLYKSQIPVIDRTLETAALMLSSNRSRGIAWR